MAKATQGVETKFVANLTPDDMVTVMVSTAIKKTESEIRELKKQLKPLKEQVEIEFNKFLEVVYTELVVYSKRIIGTGILEFMDIPYSDTFKFLAGMSTGEIKEGELPELCAYISAESNKVRFAKLSKEGKFNLYLSDFDNLFYWNLSKIKFSLYNGYSRDFLYFNSLSNFNIPSFSDELINLVNEYRKIDAAADKRKHKLYNMGKPEYREKVRANVVSTIMSNNKEIQSQMLEILGVNKIAKLTQSIGTDLLESHEEEDDD